MNNHVALGPSLSSFIKCGQSAPLGLTGAACCGVHSGAPGSCVVHLFTFSAFGALILESATLASRACIENLPSSHGAGTCGAPPSPGHQRMPDARARPLLTSPGCQQYSMACRQLLQPAPCSRVWAALCLTAVDNVPSCPSHPPRALGSAVSAEQKAKGL